MALVGVVVGALITVSARPLAPPNVALPDDTLALLKEAAENANASASSNRDAQTKARDEVDAARKEVEQARRDADDARQTVAAARAAEKAAAAAADEERVERAKLQKAKDALETERANLKETVAKREGELKTQEAKSGELLRGKDVEIEKLRGSIKSDGKTSPPTADDVAGWMRKAFQDTPPKGVSELLEKFGSLEAKIGTVNLKEMEERWRQIATVLTLDAQPQDVLILGVRTGKDADKVPADVASQFFRAQRPAKGHRIGFGWVMPTGPEMKIPVGQPFGDVKSHYDTFALPQWDPTHHTVNLTNEQLLPKLREPIRDSDAGRVVLLVPRWVACPVPTAAWKNDKAPPGVHAWKDFAPPVSVIVYGPPPAKEDPLPDWEAFCKNRNQRPLRPRGIVLTAENERELFEALCRLANPIPVVPAPLAGATPPQPKK